MDEFVGPLDEADLADGFATSSHCPRGLSLELGEWRIEDRDEPLEPAEVKKDLLGFLRDVCVDGERLTVTRRLLDDVYELLEVWLHVPLGCSEDFAGRSLREFVEQSTEAGPARAER